MNRMTLIALVVIAWLILAVSPALAHHDFIAQFAPDKPVTLRGTVTKVEWTNPHVRFYVDVSEPDGKVTTWNMELASPSALARNGWTSRTLKVGDRVTVDGYSGKVVTTRGNARSVLQADGRSLFAGTADDQGAPGGPPQ